MNRKEYTSPATTFVLLDADVMDNITRATNGDEDNVAKGTTKWEIEDDDDLGW